MNARNVRSLSRKESGEGGGEEKEKGSWSSGQHIIADYQRTEETHSSRETEREREIERERCWHWSWRWRWPCWAAWALGLESRRVSCCINDSATAPTSRTRSSSCSVWHAATTTTTTIVSPSAVWSNANWSYCVHLELEVAPQSPAARWQCTPASRDCRVWLIVSTITTAWRCTSAVLPHADPSARSHWACAMPPNCRPYRRSCASKCHAATRWN